MVPQRTCIGCRRVARQDQLLRVASAPGKRLGVGRHLPGRGAWLCPDSTGCLQTAAQRGAFNRALRTDVGAIDLAYLEAELSGRARIRPDRTAPGAGKAT